MKSKVYQIATGLLAAALQLTACAPAITPAPTEVVVVSTMAPASTVPPTTAPTVEASPLTGYKDAAYQVEGQWIALINGLSEVEAAPGSATKIITRYFGNEAVGDLNGDGQNDVAFLLTQNSGGSGTFFYVVVALHNATGYQGTNAVLLGDRIAPQTTGIENGTLVVNYADRQPGESFAVAPSVGVSKYLSVINGALVEVNP